MENTENKQNNKDKPLSQRIRATRTARIFAEERFLRYGLLAKLSLMAYALASVILAIGAFVLDGAAIISNTPLVFGAVQVDRSEAISWISLLVAVVLLPISLLMSAQRFGERALLMRVCYVNLGLLEEETKMGEKNSDLECIKMATKKYFLILALTENHKGVDFQYYKADKNEKIPTSVKSRMIWLHRGLLCFWGMVGVALPIGIVVGVFFVILHP